MRRDLRGIAAGLASSFVSRNNDQAGYWAPGLMAAHAQHAGVATVSVELLTGELSPPGLDLAGAVAHYRAWLAARLAATRLPPDARLAAAVIALEVGAADPPRRLGRATRGAPFHCVVTLTDERGRRYRADEWGHVAPHDPRLESRRAPHQWRVGPSNAGMGAVPAAESRRGSP